VNASKPDEQHLVCAAQSAGKRLNLRGTPAELPLPVVDSAELDDHPHQLLYRDGDAEGEQNLEDGWVLVEPSN